MSSKCKLAHFQPNLSHIIRVAQKMAKCAEWGVSTLITIVKCNKSKLYRMFGDNAAGCAPGSWVYPGYRLREWQPHKCRTHRRAMAIKQETSDYYDKRIPMELVPDWNCFIVRFVNSCTFFAFFTHFLSPKTAFRFGLKIKFCIKAMRMNTLELCCRETPLARLGVHQSAAQRRVANISSDGGESIGCWLLWSQQPISQSKEGRLSKYCLGQTSLAATNTSTRRRKGLVNIYIF